MYEHTRPWKYSWVRYLGEPIKSLLGKFILFGVILEVGNNARPDALKLFQCGRHLDLVFRPNALSRKVSNWSR